MGRGKDSGQRLIDAKRWTESLRRQLPLAELRTMAVSRSATTRLRSLMAMQRQLAAGRMLAGYFALGQRMVADSDNDCRWQALILSSEYIDERPDDVWSMAKRHGRSADADMRAGVATVLLEHLLERHPRRFQKLADRLANESPEFADTLGMCW